MLLAVQSIFNSHCASKAVSLTCDSVFFVESDWIEEDADDLCRVCVKRDLHNYSLILQIMNSCSPLLRVGDFVIHQFWSVLPHITVVSLESVSQPVLLDVVLLLLIS